MTTTKLCHERFDIAVEPSLMYDTISIDRAENRGCLSRTT